MTGSQASKSTLVAGMFTAICLAVIVTLLMSSSSYLRHWFVLPLMACGLITGTRALIWLAEPGDFLDPRGILSAFGLYFFCVAPLLQVWFEYRHPYMPTLVNEREWIGGMAIVNLFAILAYAFAVTHFRRPLFTRYRWQIDPRRFRLAVTAALVITACVQMFVYLRFGGLTGYLNAFDKSVGNPTSAFQGYGAIFAVSESFPILLVMGLVFWFRDPRRARSTLLVVGILAAFVVAQMLFGGLRGSRSQTAYAGFWALGMVHIFVRRVPLKAVVGIGVPLFLTFMIGYGIYKWGGREAVTTVLRGTKSSATKRVRGWEHILFTDLTRTQVQAIVLQRTVSRHSDYRYAWGRTYVAGALSAVPRFLLPGDRLPTKRKEGTEALRGRHSYVEGKSFASYVYGLAGEAMLNFGPLAVPFAFALLGCFVGLVCAVMMGLDPWDGRSLLVPFLVLLCVVLLTGDSNNVSTFIMRRGLVPLLVVLASCRFVPTAVRESSSPSRSHKAFSRA